VSDTPDAWDEADADWQDLQACWKELRPASPVTLVSTRVSDIKSQLLIVAAKASFDLRKYADRYQGKPFTGEVLADVTSKGVELFMQRWFDHLRSQDLAGLIEVVLEGQQLSPVEMKGFLTALPASLLDRIVTASVGTVTGVHALIAFEHHRRVSEIRDYTLSKEGMRTKVSFFDPKRQIMVDFYLDEAFEGPPKQEDPESPATK
jgi:hypothetical protein